MLKQLEAEMAKVGYDCQKNAFLHASVGFDGLGVLQLRRWIPEVIIRRTTDFLQQAEQNKDSFLMDVLQPS